MNAVKELSEGPPANFPDEWYEVAGEGLFWFEWRFRAFLGQLDALAISRDSAWHGLDIGCGHGVVRGQIEKSTSWTTDGADLNRLALGRNRTRSGESFYYDIHDQRPELVARYDFLILFDILEHVEDTRDFLESALFHLKPGGWLFLNVPALDDLRSRYDHVMGHLRRYDKDSLRSEAARGGLVVRDLRYWGFSMLPYLVMRKLMSGRKVSDRRVISRGMEPPAPWMERWILQVMRLETKFLRDPFLGTSLLMAAVKSGHAG